MLSPPAAGVVLWGALGSTALADGTPAPDEGAGETVLPPEVLAIEGDRDFGAYLSGACTGCHQISGSQDGIPAIVGWPDEDFVVAMHAYKRKIRPHPVMQMMAGRLSDKEIAALAAYFGALE